MNMSARVLVHQLKRETSWRLPARVEYDDHEREVAHIYLPRYLGKQLEARRQKKDDRHEPETRSWETAREAWKWCSPIIGTYQ